MADENYPRDIDDEVDPADLAVVRDELAGLTFLDPRTPPTGVPMPDEVWARIQTALAAADLAEVSTDDAEPVTAVIPVTAARPGAPTPVTGPGAARASRTARWGGGLVAASVAVVAVGLGVSVVRGGAADVAVVAGESPAASAAAAGVAADLAVEAAPSIASSLTAEDLQAPREFSFAGMVPPAQMLVDSDTAYTSDGLRAQVRSVLRRFGMANEKQAATAMTEPAVLEVPDVPASGFTADEQALRDCITKLTSLAESTALMVDRSTFDGSDAGVVVAPLYPTESAYPSGSAYPTESAYPNTAEPDMSQLHVWVVDPDCDITMEIRIRMEP